MALSEVTVSPDLADEARRELEEHNKNEIATAKSLGTPLPLDLKAPASLEKVQEVYAEFRVAFEKKYPGSVLQLPRPVLFLSKPPMHKASQQGILVCLALGKVGGGDAEELQKGHAFMWEVGEMQEFGDTDAVYVGFRVERST